MNDNDRSRAYTAGARMARDRIGREAPLDAAALERVEASDIIVIPGSYDHVEQVLDALGLAYTLLLADHVDRVRLRPEQLVVVNCPGHLPPRFLPTLRHFVAAGGTLFTTDWALRHVLEPTFPGVVAYNERPTADDVVRIEIRSTGDPLLGGVLDGDDDPQWWLEASSYPIRILQPDRVEVLLTSRELEERYGEAPVAVRFRHGDGDVIHMISHYFLQRTELRNARHSAPATSYAAEKGVPVDATLGAAMAGLRVGDVEAAQTSARFLANVVVEKKRRAQRPDRLFVYGTLMPGHVRHPAIEHFVAATRLATVAGRLYDTGAGFPAAVFGGDGAIDGWVLDIRPGMRGACLATLDRIEGDLYRPVTVTTADRDEALSYEWRGTVTGMRELAGRWRGE